MMEAAYDVPMNMVDSENLDQVFAALAHPVRRAILEQCGAEQQSIAELAEPHSMSLNAISKHVKTLEAASLIGRQQDGNFHRISTRSDAMQPALEWMRFHTELWGDSLLALKTKLENKQ